MPKCIPNFTGTTDKLTCQLLNLLKFEFGVTHNSEVKNQDDDALLGLETRGKVTIELYAHFPEMTVSSIKQRGEKGNDYQAGSYDLLCIFKRREGFMKTVHRHY